MFGRTYNRLLQGNSSLLLRVHVWVVFTFEHFEDFLDFPIVFVTGLGHSFTKSALRIFAQLSEPPPSLWQESWPIRKAISCVHRRQPKWMLYLFWEDGRFP